ncbi:MAG: GNAT family N-acetyltransferase [Gammaproteobacteria bacterium]|jgi:predicted GNAT family N-acyltransferase
MMDIIVKQPETAEEFKQYLDLRWRVLRAPWGEPKGSEIDNIEDQCFHIMVTVNEKVTGVGRLQYNSNSEAQIRYMAVDQAYERNQIGRMIVNSLEQEARNRNINSIVLEAREPAVGFYKKLGYHTEKKSYMLFDEIQHFRMRKRLTNQKQV